jgi:ADP-ribose pyrophosphatase
MTDSVYPDAPRVAVGAVVIHDNRVLLVRRGNPPAHDFWAIPGGRIELGETLQAAAEREILEETGVSVRAGDPCFVFDALDRDDAGRVRYHYVIVDLTAEYVTGEPVPGDDAVDARWFTPSMLKTATISSKTLELLRDRFNFFYKESIP